MNFTTFGRFRDRCGHSAVPWTLHPPAPDRYVGDSSACCSDKTADRRSIFRRFGSDIGQQHRHCFRSAVSLTDFPHSGCPCHFVPVFLLWFPSGTFAKSGRRSSEGRSPLHAGVTSPARSCWQPSGESVPVQYQGRCGPVYRGSCEEKSSPFWFPRAW